MNDRECLRTSTNVWRSLCDHCELMANCIRKPIRHTFATGETSITFEHHTIDRECLPTATNVWRSFAIITNSWRTAFASPFAIHSPQCETSKTEKKKSSIQTFYIIDNILFFTHVYTLVFVIQFREYHNT